MTRWAALAFLGAAGLLGIALLPDADRRPAPHGACAPAEAGHRTIYVVSHGWHAGIAARRGTLPDSLWPEQLDFPDAAFLEVGWGDSAFYRTDEPGAWTTLRAALRPTPSVVHVAAFGRPPAQVFAGSEVLPLAITQTGADSLAAFFHRAYARDAAGRPRPLGPGRYGTSRFYAGHERYHLFYNCNAWVAHALKAAGCPIGTTRVLTVETLLRRVRRLR
ncbi:MAG: DUF2459 domain-containing protein [Rhodothermales bacterium]|nr:DUF2459 domain-containing protein [Rhodothermales bacterium]